MNVLTLRTVRERACGPFDRGRRVPDAGGRASSRTTGVARLCGGSWRGAL